MGERRRFFEDLLLLQPELTIIQAIRMVKERYGISVDPKYAQKAYAAARELHGINLKKAEKPKKRERKEAHLEYRNPAALPEPAPKEDSYLVAYQTASGAFDNYSPATGRNDLLKCVNALIGKGIKPNHIKVFKELKTDIQVEVKVSF